MTIADTRTNDQTIGTLVSDAYRMATLLGDYQTLDTARMQKGMRFLDTILKGAAFNGASARVVAAYQLTVTGDGETSSFELPEYTMAAVGDAMYVEDDETNETPVLSISRQAYQALGDKTTAGRPTMYFQDRSTTPITVWLYPVPDAPGTARFQLQRRRADVIDSTDTLDMEPHWHIAARNALARDLALSSGLKMDRVNFLNTSAREDVALAYNESSQKQPVVARLNHPTPWSR